MGFYLGIDVSTTATKALLINEKGSVQGVASNFYSYKTPYLLWSEQSPEVWWEATKTTIKQVIVESGIQGKEISGIGLTGQMHGLVLLDKAGNVLRSAILWNDQRTGLQCDEIRERFADIYERFEF